MGKLAEYEIKRILPRIEAILSLEVGRKSELRSWIRQHKFEDDLTNFYAISESATYKLNAQWMKAILAALPDKFWSVSQEAVALLDQTGTAASLRLLTSAYDGKKQQESVLHLAARKEVMQALLDGINEAHRGAYRDMLSWIDCPEKQGYDAPGDTSFGLALTELERMMDSMVAEQDQRWRRESRWDDSHTTPVEVRNSFSAVALRQTFYFMARCWEYGKNMVDTPDSLLALLSANMSCNKAVLEYAALNYRGREALEMTVSFLHELNAQGVHEIPTAFDDLGPAECDEAISTKFKTWFGHKGDFIEPGTFFVKHMTNSDIQELVDLSRQLQAEYINARGSNPFAPASQAQNIHGSSTNRFIFALVLAAAFYSKARTDQEFVVGKNASYAVFPDRQSIKQKHLLTIHAKDLLLKSYGLVFFGNSGWNLKPDDIKQYAQGTENRRLHNQVAILCAVKGRTSKELMGLYDSLKQLRTRPELVFERLGMQPS
ncbi:MAG: hypothetical protein V4673_09670 [Pseudomonadota bacterium]